MKLLLSALPVPKCRSIVTAGPQLAASVGAPPRKPASGSSFPPPPTPGPGAPGGPCSAPAFTERTLQSSPWTQMDLDVLLLPAACSCFVSLYFYLR